MVSFRRWKWVWTDLSMKGKVEKSILLSEGGNRINRPGHLPFTPKSVFLHLEQREFLPALEANVIARLCRGSGLKTSRGVPSAGFTGGQIAGFCVLAVVAMTVFFIEVLGWA